MDLSPVWAERDGFWTLPGSFVYKIKSHQEEWYKLLNNLVVDKIRDRCRLVMPEPTRLSEAQRQGVECKLAERTRAGDLRLCMRDFVVLPCRTAVFGAQLLDHRIRTHLVRASPPGANVTPLSQYAARRILLAARDSVAFTIKARHAQAAGAVALVVVDQPRVGCRPAQGSKWQCT
eukprot:SAG11_NODE_710_length_7643_cov_26.058177_3_plen_176_part_00